jgi:hypothetical protein
MGTKAKKKKMGGGGSMAPASLPPNPSVLSGDSFDA